MHKKSRFKRHIELDLENYYFRADIKFTVSEEGLRISKLFLSNISISDNGTYNCNAKNNFGKSSSRQSGLRYFSEQKD